MRLHRFFIAEKIGSKKELAIDSPELVKQISRVFRLGAGDKVVVFDGSGNDFECVIVREAFLDKARDKSPRGGGQLQLEVGEVRLSRYMPIKKVVLYQAVIKKDNFEWIVEKATELGVTDIVPVLAERSEKKDLNIERLQKIAIEASEQCGRGDVPVVHSARSDLAGVQTQPQAVFIGPEGGWSPAELEMFHNNKIQVCSLGNQVLRAETAAVVALSKVLM